MTTVVCILAAVKIKLGTVQFFYTCAPEKIVDSLKKTQLIAFDGYRIITAATNNFFDNLSSDNP